MKIDAGSIQDLFHYALAMEGNSNSTFDSASLVDRLDAAKRVYEKLTTLDADVPNPEQWDEFINEPRRFSHEAELANVGKALRVRVEIIADQMGIDARSGERITDAWMRENSDGSCPVCFGTGKTPTSRRCHCTR